MIDKEMNKNIDKKAVGQRIKLIRMSKGFTQETFGKLLDVDKASTCKWEKGITLPNAKRMASICKIADITLNELLYGYNFNLYDEVEKLSKKEKLLLAKRLLEDVTNEEERKEEIERKKAAIETITAI